MISKHRALELDRLDASKVDSNIKDRKQRVCQKCGLEINSGDVADIDKSIKSGKDEPHVNISESSNVEKDSQEEIKNTSVGTCLTCSCDKENKVENPLELKGNVENTHKDTGCVVQQCEETKASNGVSNSGKVDDTGDGLFCLVDMESEHTQNRKTTVFTFL